MLNDYKNLLFTVDPYMPHAHQTLMHHKKRVKVENKK